MAETAERAVQNGSAAPWRPDVVMILADDLGLLGHRLLRLGNRHPNLDALAGSGLRFSQARTNCAHCCQTPRGAAYRALPVR